MRQVEEKVMFLSVYVPDFTQENMVMITDRQIMHRKIQTAFKADRKNAGVLYAFHKQSKKHPPIIYVSSFEKPVCKIEGFECREIVDCDKTLKSISVGEKIVFDIYASPCRSGKGKKHYFSDVEERIEWMSRRMNDVGAELIKCRENRKENIKIGHDKARGGVAQKTGWHYTCLVEIKEPKAFVDAVINGVGTGKAYGMGMIQIRKRNIS